MSTSEEKDVKEILDDLAEKDGGPKTPAEQERARELLEKAWQTRDE